MTSQPRNPGDEPSLAKRLILGDPLTSEKLDEQLLPKKRALPIFASDALSSVAYAPQELLMILLIGGIAFLAFSPWVAAAVVVLLIVVVASYRQLIKAYPSGGGDYEVARKNLGEVPGVVVASALLVDWALVPRVRRGPRRCRARLRRKRSACSGARLRSRGLRAVALSNCGRSRQSRPTPSTRVEQSAM